MNTNSENKEKCWRTIFRQTKQKPDRENWAAQLSVYFSYVFFFCLPGLVCNAIPMHEASIVTPVASNNLWNCLEGNPNRRFICDGFRYGFHLGVTSVPDVKRKPACVSPPSLTSQDPFTQKINAELIAKRVLGPFKSLPAHVIVSPLYVISKSTPGKYRLIHNLSSPNGNSINESIDTDMKSVSYCNVLDVAMFLASNPDSKCFMAKVDLKDAYRCVPVHPDDWKFLGMCYKGHYFIDTCLPMGCASSCNIFSTISDALSFAFQRENGDCKCFNYLDDFLIVAKSKSRCSQALACFMDMLECCGFPISHDKTIRPHTRVEFLGLDIDSETWTFMVPDSKKLKTLASIADFVSKPTQRVRTIQQLVGKLTFLCTTFLAGRCLLASLHEQLRGVLSNEGWYRKRVTCGVKDDLMLWSSFLESNSGRPFHFLFPMAEPSLCIETDASGSYGFGAVMDGRWFSGQWLCGWWSEQHITLLELYPVYVALQLWSSEISNNTILVRTDNSALVDILTNFYSRNHLINKLVKKCVFTLMSCNTVLRVTHIPGKDNVIPDRLSRGLCCTSLLDMASRACLPPAIQPSAVKDMLSA